jgi:glutamate-1-semialdehyde 2,1-aminomutase
VLSTGEPYERMHKTGTALMEGLETICADKGVPAHIVGVPAMFSVFFGDESPRDFRDAGNHDEELYASVVRGMIHRGVMPVDDAKEPWFLSAAHGEEEVALSLNAFEEALGELT